MQLLRFHYKKLFLLCAFLLVILFFAFNQLSQSNILKEKQLTIISNALNEEAVKYNEISHRNTIGRQEAIRLSSLFVNISQVSN